jgi:hypothetical protein
MDPSLIALPFTTLITGGLAGFLVGSIVHERRSVRDRVTFDLPPDQAPILAAGALTEEAATALSEKFDRLRDLASSGNIIALPEPSEPPACDDITAESIMLATDAVRHAARAIAELTRFQHDGPGCGRFPLDEDVEVDLAKALQSVINILLAYQPSEGDRDELGQLEAALHKFITDYGA